MATLSLFFLPPNPHIVRAYPPVSLPYRLRPAVPIRTTTTHCLSIKASNDQTTTTSSAAAHDGGFDDLRVLFAAGGTGGHIYPAVAIADELKFTNPSTQILFIGAPNSMESTAVASAGFDYTAVYFATLFSPLLSFRNILLPYNIIKSATLCYKIIREFKPQIVVGTGGYVSFPVGLAAVFAGKKLVIQEQNSVPGIANWVLSFFADLVFVAFNSTIERFPNNGGGKCVVCGNPVRLSLKRTVSKEEAMSHFFSVEEEAATASKVVLVLGGTLGAQAVNIALLNCYSLLLLENENLFIIWQTGVETFDEMESLVREHPNVFLTPKFGRFLHSMDSAYAAADLVLSRAGAMTCYEILALGKPSILIPSPNAAEGHQFNNASLMADVAGAKMITEDELDSTTLQNAIEEILGDEQLMEEMKERALKAAKPNASSDIVKQILSRIKLS